MRFLTRAGATAAVLAASVLLTPSPTHAMCPDNTGPDTATECVAEHLRPLEGIPRSPDVYQGWIDSGRAQLNDEFVAECLRPLGGIPRSPDVYEGWIDGCRARAGD